MRNRSEERKLNAKKKQELVEELIDESSRDYTRFMKKCIVIKEM